MGCLDGSAASATPRLHDSYRRRLRCCHNTIDLLAGQEMGVVFVSRIADSPVGLLELVKRGRRVRHSRGEIEQTCEQSGSLA